MSIIFSLEGMVTNPEKSDLWEVWTNSWGQYFKSEVTVCYNIDLPTSMLRHMLQIFISQKVLVKWQWFVKAQLLLLVIKKDVVFGGDNLAVVVMRCRAKEGGKRICDNIVWKQ